MCNYKAFLQISYIKYQFFCSKSFDRKKELCIQPKRQKNNTSVTPK